MSKSDHSIGKMIQFKLVVTHTTSNQVHKVKSSVSGSLHIHKEGEDMLGRVRFRLKNSKQLQLNNVSDGSA